MAGPSGPARILLWDYGNVLVRWEPGRLYARLIPDPERLTYFLSEVCPMSWHLQHDRGRPMAETIPERQALFPDWADEIAAWKTGFGDMIGGQIDSSVAIVEALAAAGVPQFVLSNLPSEMVETSFGPFAFPRLFADAIISGDHGVVKPDPALFDIALARMGRPNPGQVLFIDDSQPNIDAARSLGLRAHRFVEGMDLAGLVRAEGLLA